MRTAFDLLRLPGVDVVRLAKVWPDLAAVPREAAEQIQIDARYAGYLDRQEADILAFRRDEGLRLDADIDFRRIGGLSAEVAAILERVRPATLGAAGRLPGITPAALVALLRHVRRDAGRASA